MRRPSSLGDLMLAKAAALGEAPAVAATAAAAAVGLPGVAAAAAGARHLQHYSSAPEGAAAEAAAAAAAGEAQFMNDTVMQYVHPSHTPSQAAHQFWQMQAHLWQLQLVQQQQRQQQQRRRRRHSVCMGSMQHRCWTRPYGVMGEMMPFEEEAGEWPQSLSAPSGSSLRISNQQQQHQGEAPTPAASSFMFGHIVPPSPIAEDPENAAGGLSSGSLCGLQGSTARGTTLPSAAFSSALGSPPSDPGTAAGVSGSLAALSAQTGLSPLPGGSSFFGEAGDEDADDVHAASDVASATSEQQQLQQQAAGDETLLRSKAAAAETRPAAAAAATAALAAAAGSSDRSAE
jgi:hypothetical protein